MLLKQLKLENIRSYTNETINFTKGSTLLSGDIGSGKSTVLLAIEFALFGTSRPDLPAESLLRKGAAHGSVELILMLNPQENRDKENAEVREIKEIVIRRNLKKEKNIIKQTAGHIIVNNTKKELMPIELKAEMISLLGYPEEFISKNRNYIYRYTVYTPQEEMKLILQEDAEIRLDVLRKIFNVDKYKTIRDNLQHFLKLCRTDMAVLTAKTEPLPEYKDEIKRLTEEKQLLDWSVKEVHPKFIGVKTTLEEKKKALKGLENKQGEFLALKQELKTNQILLIDKEEGIASLKNKEEELSREINELIIPDNKTLEQVKSELKQSEENKNLLLAKKSSLQEKTAQIKKSIKELRNDISSINEKVSRLKEKEELKEKLINDLKEKEKLQRIKDEVGEELQKLSGDIVKNKTLLHQSKELQKKISLLENCPTCLQKVSPEHKQKITEEELAKTREAEAVLTSLEDKYKEIFTAKKDMEKNWQELLAKENALARVAWELVMLLEQKELICKKEKLIESLTKENEFLAEELKELESTGKIDKINADISESQSQINILSKKQILQKNLSELEEQIKNYGRQIALIRKKISESHEELKDKFKEKNDFSAEIEEKKSDISAALEQEKELAIKLAQLKIQIENLSKSENLLSEKIEKLSEEKNKLVRLKNSYRWLEDFFLKLTYAIEKHIMVSIHNHFNQMFQEWFSILIDDENVYAKIDDSFTPIIEQNGYEISFSNLSGGEKTSASLAYRLALNRVINDVISGINTKELLILDEPTDGFSTEQLDKVREVLERLNLGQTIIVSHESKIESFVENVVRISKQGHVSMVD